MTPAGIPVDDIARVEALRQLGMLDTLPEERFDRLTRLAQAFFKVPICVVSLVDSDRQWFKSKVGVEARESARDISFCGHVVADNSVLVVEDALADERFHDNPSVINAPGIRFYAGYPLYDVTGKAVGSFCIADERPRRLSVAELRHLADFAALVERELTSREAASSDHLTGLLNRRGFELVSEQALQMCSRTASRACLLFIDLDRFKAINDRLGHAVGDRALQRFSRCLTETFRASDVVARLGGDEFVILMTDASEADMQRATSRLRADVQALNLWPGTPYELRFSVGYAQLEASRMRGDLRAALDLADSRMYSAKHSRRTGRDTYEFAEGCVPAELTGTLEQDLVAALDANQLRPAFQPIVELTSGEIVAFEALARWKHPLRGEVSPGLFIPVAEESGHISRLGEYILMAACEFMSCWRRMGLTEHIKLSVNVSRAQLHDTGFPARVRAILSATGLPPGTLQLEITESLAMDDDGMRSALSAIRETGVRLSLDDFGTGHSSLAALHRLPVNQVKIDRAFVSELATSAYHKAVVRAALDVAGTLGLDVVAEGVETAAQSEALMALGCKWGQGWLFSKAMEAADVPGFVERLCVLEQSS